MPHDPSPLSGFGHMGRELMITDTALLGMRDLPLEIHLTMYKPHTLSRVRLTETKMGKRH